MKLPAVLLLVALLCTTTTAEASFTRSLTTGDSGADVTYLQQLLNSLGKTVTPSGEETTYFGSQTASAIKALQCEHGIVCEGASGFGVVGPRTQALLLSLSEKRGNVLGDSISGLVREYALDEGSGTETKDSIAQNVGTLSGPTWTEGKEGKALQFTDIRSKVFISAPALSEKTITFWAKPDAIKYYSIVYEDEHQHYGGFNGYGQFRVNWKNNAGEKKAANIKANAVAGSWQHFAVVYSTSSISVYRNGKLEGTASAPDGIFAAKISAIGGRLKSDGTFGGALDEFRVYSRALSASEIGEVYKHTDTVTPPPTTTPTSPTPVDPEVTPVTTTGTYYVDFASGSDSNAGTKEAPWKHAPGDPKATGNPAATKLAPGNVVQFKGGVVYRGVVDVKWSGTSGKPITYKGTGWGEGKAIIDGSEPLTGLKKCTSSSECGGNANWANLYRAPLSVPSFITVDPELHLHIMSGDQAMTVAQQPASTNKYYQAPENFYVVPFANVTATTLKDSRLATLGGAGLVGSYVHIWGTPNEVHTRKITGYNATTNTITFNSFTPYKDKDARYAIGNSAHSAVLDTPGEYYVNLAKKEIIVWPIAGTDIGNITASVRPYGINLGAQSHISVDGFLIRKQTGDGQREGQGIAKFLATSANNLTISNNEVAYLHSPQKGGAIGLLNAENSVVRDNFVHDTGGNMRGISVSGRNVVIKNNHVKNVARTGIYFGEMTKGVMDGNLVEDNNSVHGNGMTVYQNSTDITISNNTVRRSNIAFTMEQSSNLKIFNNVFDGSEETNAVFADWGGMTGTNYLLNNTIVGGNKSASLVLNSAKAEGAYIVKNNIIDGGGPKTSKTTYANNLYVALSWSQSARYGWSLDSTEKYVPDLSSVFVNPAGGDFALKAGSPAINAGASLSTYLTTDIVGTKRPVGDRYDIGAYEYVTQ